MDKVVLCFNCLSPGSTSVEVGPERGTQRDPYRERVSLCKICAIALANGDFQALHSRYREQALYTRDPSNC